jgi:hypothetical protein
MRWFLGLIAALAVTSAAVAQVDVSSTQAEISDEPAHTPLPIPECIELDEEEQAAYDALLAKPVFFDDLYFDCDSDWFAAETTLGAALKSLGEVPLVDQLDTTGARTLTLRRLAWGGQNYKLSRLDCDVNLDGKSTGGRFLLDEENPWVQKMNGRRLLKMTAADCNFIVQMLDDFEPMDVASTLPCDSSGAIYLHANTVITEHSDYIKGSYVRDGYCDLIDNDPKSKAAEAFLDQLFRWLDDRARESGRKVRR